MRLPHPRVCDAILGVMLYGIAIASLSAFTGCGQSLQEEADEAVRTAKMERRLNTVGIPALAKTEGGFLVIRDRGMGELRIDWVVPCGGTRTVATSIMAKRIIEVAAWDEERQLDRLLRKLFQAQTRDATAKVPTADPFADLPL
ncbi:MAG TPA: hypothetical protein VJ837_04655 [Candidatus Paceibacterota bacterium]|nr:hypothetical protein [Candidatus Paceibacterota bacterium]